MKTTYRLMEEEDFAKLADKFDIARYPAFPTVVAERDGDFVGIMGTEDRKDFILVDPFDAVSGYVGFNLFKAYENLMLMMGVSSYYFCVYKDNQKHYKQVKRISTNFELPTSPEDDKYWFEHVVVNPSMEVH